MSQRESDLPHHHESSVDRQIRLAQERGLFDDLPGAGKPLPGLSEPDDENWWIRGKLREEGVSAEALLPTSIQLRKELDRLPAALRELRSEQEVREAVAEVNRKVAEHLRFPSGPRVRVGPVKVEDALSRWRSDRGVVAAAPSPPADHEEPAPRPRRWWRRG